MSFDKHRQASIIKRRNRVILLLAPSCRMRGDGSVGKAYSADSADLKSCIREAKAGTHCRNLEAGTEVETTEECPLWLGPAASLLELRPRHLGVVPPPLAGPSHIN